MTWLVKQLERDGLRLPRQSAWLLADEELAVALQLAHIARFDGWLLLCVGCGKAGGGSVCCAAAEFAQLQWLLFQARLKRGAQIWNEAVAATGRLEIASGDEPLKQCRGRGRLQGHDLNRV